MNRTMIAVAAGVMTLAGAGSASAQALVIEGPYAAPVYEVAPAPSTPLRSWLRRLHAFMPHRP